MKLNTMLLQGDKNIFCAFQIFPATRTEAALFQQSRADNCPMFGQCLNAFSLYLGCFRILDFVQIRFVCSVCNKNILKLEVHEQSAVAKFM